MTKREEQRLIARAAKGCQASASELIRAHQRSVHAYLLRLCGNADLADDITQEAFVRVLCHLDRFDMRYRFSTWLFTIARRLLMNASQKMKPRYDSDMVQSAGGKGDASMAETSARQERTRDALQEGLMQLSAEQREVLVLFHQLDWPISLIAEHLDMPEGTIKSHLHRGRRKLRTVLVGSDRLRELAGVEEPA